MLLLLPALLALPCLSPADLVVPPATATIQISKTGNCPGAITITVTGATPNRPVTVLYGNAGSFVWPGIVCNGLIIPLQRPNLAAARTADNAGKVTFTINLPQRACGMSVTAVDITTCTAAPPVTL